MIELKRIRGYKHGKDIKNRKSIIFGFKSRRNFLKTFEGTHIGHRRLLKCSVNVDIVVNSWSGFDHEQIISFLSSCIGKPFSEVSAKFLKRCKRLKVDEVTPLRILEEYVSIRQRKRWQRFLGSGIGWTGFYLDDNGIVRYNYSEATVDFSFKPRRIPKKIIYENIQNIRLPFKDPKNRTANIGNLWIIRFEGNRLWPEKVPVVLIDRFDYDRQEECTAKKAEWVSNYIRVYVPGFSDCWIVPGSVVKQWACFYSRGTRYYYAVRKEYLMKTVKVYFKKRTNGLYYLPEQNITTPCLSAARKPIEEFMKSTMNPVPDWLSLGEYIIKFVES